MSHNTLFHFLLHKFIPNIKTYDDYLKSKVKFIFDENSNNTNIDFINSAFIDSFLYKSKMEALNEFQLNKFITNEKKDNLLHYFNSTQVVYYKLKKIYKLYIIKKAKKYDNDTDLCLTPLNSFKNNISIIQENTIYTFKINDLIRLIMEGITYTYDLFLEPKMPKNPYNNLEFENHDLYNIYFHIINNTKIAQPPVLLHLFFKSEFNLDQFLLVNEAYLKDIAIKKYYEDIKNDTESIYENLSLMLEKSTILSISNGFPEHTIVSNLQHCLLDFLYTEYSYNPTIRRKHKRSLTSKLKDFKAKNPTFGRIIRRVNHNAINLASSRRRRHENFENFLDSISTNTNTPNNSDLSSTNATGMNNETTTESEPEPIDEILLDNHTQVSESTINIEESSDDDNEISFSIDSSNNISNNSNNRLHWTHDIIDNINNEILTRTYSFQYTSTPTRLNIENSDNLITSSRFIDNSFIFPDAPIHPITNTIRTSNTSLQINEISNQPYDAYVGPFTSPSNSSASISPTSRSLNIDNSFDFSNFQN